MTVKRPVMRYHGGKWRLAPWIISHFPDHKVYVEPFGGAASVLMQKTRSYSEVYNDMDGEVVNLFKILRDPEKSEQLISVLHLTPYSKDEFKLSYEKSDDPIEQARRTVYRSFAGFGGAASGRQTGFRACSNRSNTSPAHVWANYPGKLPDIIDRLRGVVIENKAAIEIINQHDTDKTLTYADPPYPHSTRMSNAHCSGVYRHEMTDDDHQYLAKTLRNVDGMVVLSGYPCDLYDKDLYPDWMRVQKNAFADGTLERTEVLWINPKAEIELNKRKRVDHPSLFD